MPANPNSGDLKLVVSDDEVMIQLIDLSKKVLYDNLAMERQYQTLINATISHEMRNPLNSIMV